MAPMSLSIPFLPSPPRINVIRLQGMIASGGRAGLNDAALAPMIERAFRRGKPAAVALALNSPGGAPVQSSLIAARIRRLADEKDIPVHAFVEDVAASGGYWLASAADHIWVDASSILGSIGVISAGFGLNDLIARYGIERRVHTAGKSKSMLDPFRPENPADVKRLEHLLGQIHTSFINQVKARRAHKLGEGTDLFNGDIWVGAEAVRVGLADGLGHLVAKMKEIHGDKVRFRTYGPRRTLLQRFGAQVVGEGLTALEERAAYARFGV